MTGTKSSRINPPAAKSNARFATAYPNGSVNSIAPASTGACEDGGVGSPDGVPGRKRKGVSAFIVVCTPRPANAGALESFANLTDGPASLKTKRGAKMR